MGNKKWTFLRWTSLSKWSRMPRVLARSIGIGMSETAMEYRADEDGYLEIRRKPPLARHRRRWLLMYCTDEMSRDMHYGTDSMLSNRYNPRIVARVRKISLFILCRQIQSRDIRLRGIYKLPSSVWLLRKVADVDNFVLADVPLNSVSARTKYSNWKNKGSGVYIHVIISFSRRSSGSFPKFPKLFFLFPPEGMKEWHFLSLKEQNGISFPFGWSNRSELSLW